METAFAQQLLTTIQQDYENIADHFSQTRQAAWAEFELIDQLVHSGDTLLDVGCGNGRLATKAIQLSLSYIGIDISEQLLTHARRQFPEQQFPNIKFINGSMLKLPIADSSVQMCAAIASVQHIPSEQLRLQALHELYRVTAPGGYLLMMNWNLHQPDLQHYFVRNDDRFDPGDALVPWKNAVGQVRAERYYHGFMLEELTTLCTDVGWHIREQHYSTHGQPADQTTGHNIITVVQRKK